MADNTNQAGTDDIRTLEDGSGIKWPAGVCCYVVSLGSPDVLQPVLLTAGLPVQPQTGATFPVSGTFWQATQPVSGTFWQATQPVSAASLPLPTGAATSANQDTLQTAADSIDAKTPALGQALAAASSPVVLTAAQLTTLTPPAAITGFATETTLGGVLTTSDFDTKVGSLTETAPASDTASSGLNGRLQRIAQRITSLIALIPTALGANGGFKIEGVASGTIVPVGDGSGTLTVDAPVGTPLFARLSDGSAALGAGHGTAAAALRVELPTDGTGVVGLNAGTNAIGKLTSNSGVTIGAVEVAASQTIGIAAGTAAIGSVNNSPTTVGGWDSMNATSADGATALTNSAQAIKASAGKFGGYYFYNPNATAVWLHIYNVASGSVTVGTTNPKLSYCLPATSGANVEMSNGISFDTALSAAATATAGGNGAPSSALEALFYYK